MAWNIKMGRPAGKVPLDYRDREIAASRRVPGGAHGAATHAAAPDATWTLTECAAGQGTVCGESHWADQHPITPMNPALFPRLVAVETTSFCSARCVFCPNDSLKRGKRHMTDELFESIIEQCREFPLGAIEPFIQGDPFSDPKILPRLEMIHQRLPKTKLRLYTNGYNLTPERADAIAECNIDHLFISLNTTDPEHSR